MNRILYSALDESGELRFAFHPFNDQKGLGGHDPVPHDFPIAWVPHPQGPMGDVYISCRGKRPDWITPGSCTGIRKDGRPSRSCFTNVRLNRDGRSEGDPQPNHGAMIKMLLRLEKE